MVNPMVSLELPWFGEMIGSRQGVLMNVVSALIKETEPGSGPSRGTGFAAALVLERVSVIRHNSKGKERHLLLKTSPRALYNPSDGISLLLPLDFHSTSSCPRHHGLAAQALHSS